MLDIPSDMTYELQLLIINTLLKPLNPDAYSYMIKTGMYFAGRSAGSLWTDFG